MYQDTFFFPVMTLFHSIAKEFPVLYSCLPLPTSPRPDSLAAFIPAEVPYASQGQPLPWSSFALSFTCPSSRPHCAFPFWTRAVQLFTSTAWLFWTFYFIFFWVEFIISQIPCHCFLFVSSFDLLEHSLKWPPKEVIRCLRPCIAKSLSSIKLFQWFD